MSLNIPNLEKQNINDWLYFEDSNGNYIQHKKDKTIYKTDGLDVNSIIFSVKVYELQKQISKILKNENPTEWTAVNTEFDDENKLIIKRNIKKNNLPTDTYTYTDLKYYNSVDLGRKVYELKKKEIEERREKEIERKNIDILKKVHELIYNINELYLDKLIVKMDLRGRNSKTYPKSRTIQKFKNKITELLGITSELSSNLQSYLDNIMIGGYYISNWIHYCY